MAANVPIIFSSQNRASADITQLRNQMRQLSRTVRESTRATADNTRVFDRNRRAAASLRTTLSGLHGVLLGIGAVRIAQSIGRTGVEFDRLRILIQASSNSAQEFATTMQEVRRLARLPGITFESAAGSISQLTALGFSAQFAAEATQEIGNALALSATSSAQDTPRIVRAFAQIRESAQVMQQDLNQIIQSAPLLGRAIREEFGSIRAEVIRLQVNPQEFLQRVVGRAQASIPRVRADASFNVIQNFRNAVRELSDAIAQLALPRLTSQIERATRAIEQNTQQIVDALRGAAALVVASVERIIGSFGELVNFARSAALAFVFVRIASLANSLVTSLVTAGTVGSALAISLRPTIHGLSGFSRVLGIALAGLTSFSTGVAVFAGIIATISLVRFVSGLNNAAREANTLSGRVNTLTQSVRDLNIEATQTPRGGIFQGIEQPAVTQLTTRLSRVVGTLRNVREEINRLEQGRQAPIETLRSQTQAELARLRSIETSGIAGRGVRFDIEQQRGLLQNINTLLRERALLQAEILRIETQITSTNTPTDTPTEQPVSLTGEQIRAGNQLFSQRLRLLGLQNRETQRQREAASELDLQFQERVAARQTAIAEDLGRRALVISQQTTNRLLGEQERLADEERRLDFQRNADRLGAIFSRVEADALDLRNYTQYANRILDARRDLRNRSRRIDREIQRDVDVARLTPERIDIVGTLVDTTPAENARERLRRIYDQLIAERERTRDTLTNIRLGIGLSEADRQQIRDLETDLLLGGLTPDMINTRLALLYDSIIEFTQRQLRPLTEGVANIAGSFLTDAAGYPGRLLQAERDAAEERLDIEDDLQARLESIRNDAFLSARQRARQIATAEENAAQRRAETERNLSDDKREAYRGFIRDALLELSRLVTAHVQAAVLRATVNQIGTLIGPGLAALGTGGGIGVGLAAITGLQLLASSFHSPENDRVARARGFREAQQQLFSNPRAFGRQSADDLSREHNAGFREGLQSVQTSNASTGNRQPVIIQIEGRELGRVLIDMQERGELPALT